jgi:hypothetical protein
MPKPLSELSASLVHYADHDILHPTLEVEKLLRQES